MVWKYISKWKIYSNGNILIETSASFIPHIEKNITEPDWNIYFMNNFNLFEWNIQDPVSLFQTYFTGKYSGDFFELVDKMITK